MARRHGSEDQQEMHKGFAFFVRINIPPNDAPCTMVDEKGWAAVTLFVVGIVTALDLFGTIPSGLAPAVGLLAIVLLLAIGLLVLGEIRDGMRNAR